MKRLFQFFFLCALAISPADATQRLIVRVLGGQLVLNLTCGLLGCNVIRSLEDPTAQLFLIGIPDTANLVSFLNSLLSLTSIVDVEVDSLQSVLQSRPPIPQALYDSTPVPYFGVNVRSGYVNQPAAQIVRLAEAQQSFNVSGTGPVAVIDTGVDPNHPVLRPVLGPGYDFTRNVQGNASEMADVNQSTAAVVDGVPPSYVSDYSAAVLDQSTAAVVDNRGYAAFGHGTMVSGVIHLVAPRATILPLKAFGPDGTGYTSDILRAVYMAVRAHARVINMSFSMPQSSPELKRSLDYATSSGTICVASAGNEGQATLVYPAAYNNVIGVASTTNDDIRSVFSNYGPDLVWVAAPGEGVVTTYPYGTYAAAWGTSFSAPLVSGTAALLLQARGSMTPADAATAIGKAQVLSSDMGHGRLDIVKAIQSVVSPQ